METEVKTMYITKWYPLPIVKMEVLVNGYCAWPKPKFEIDVGTDPIDLGDCFETEHGANERYKELIQRDLKYHHEKIEELENYKITVNSYE